MSGEHLADNKVREEQAIARASKAQRLVKGTSKGPWVRWKGLPHVMQGPALENTKESFRGKGPGGGTIAECDRDTPERKAHKNAELMAQSRELVPELASDVVYLLERLTKYRLKLAKLLSQSGSHGELAQELAFLLEQDGIQIQ